MLQNLKRYEKAEEMFEEAIQLDPTYFKAYIHQGFLYYYKIRKII